MTVNLTRPFSPENAAISDLTSATKDIIAGKAWKKEGVGCKLLLLIIVGLCGLSICFIRAGHRSLYVESAYYTRHVTINRIIRCPAYLTSLTEGLHLHYPKPKSFERKECMCTPVHYFVILSMQRSGSGWFETLLNNHPNISSHGEIFTGREKHKNLSTILTKLDDVYNLDYRSSAIKDECTAAVGFKWMLNQGLMEYHKEILEYFNKKGVSVIFLIRQNLLRRLVSILANAYDREVKLLNGTHKSHVHSKEEAETLASFKPTINHKVLVTSFSRILEVTENAVRIFNTTRHIVVYYEELLKRNEKLDQAQEFLGVPPMTLKSQQVKIHTKPLSEQIQNWDEVYKVLQGTKFEEFLAHSEFL